VEAIVTSPEFKALSLEHGAAAPPNDPQDEDIDIGARLTKLMKEASRPGMAGLASAEDQKSKSLKTIADAQTDTITIRNTALFQVAMKKKAVDMTEVMAKEIKDRERELSAMRKRDAEAHGLSSLFSEVASAAITDLKHRQQVAIKACREG
jgi:gamma-glutamylcysteine synthetase